MPDPFPFAYECRECGAVQVVTRADTSEVADHQRPHLTADAVLQEIRGWGHARPDPVCSGCSGA